MAPVKVAPEMSGEFAGVSHKVPARNVGRMLLEVDVVPTNGASIGGQLVTAGTHKVLVYKDEIDGVLADVQTDEQKLAWSMAEKTFQSQADREFGKIKNPEDRRKAEARWGQSVAAIFAQTFQNGLPPIRSMRVLNDNVPAPSTTENVQANQIANLTEALVGALRAAKGGDVQPRR